MLASGFKLAGNSFLGALAHIAPRIRGIYVEGLYQDMERAKTAALGAGLQCVALISDSMIFASSDATKGKPVDLTDDQVERALDAINAATVCTFRVDKDYANLVIAHSQRQFGNAWRICSSNSSSSSSKKILERGVVASLSQMPRAGAHLLDLMQYVIQKLCGGGGSDSGVVTSPVPPPSAMEALEEMIQREEAVRSGGLKPKEGLTVSNFMIKERMLLSLIGMQPPKELEERARSATMDPAVLKRKRDDSSGALKMTKRSSSSSTETWQGASLLRASAAAWGILLN